MAEATSKSPKLGTMKWDVEKREYLCCLFRFFHQDKEAFCAVFSEIFRAQLLERGIRKNLSTSTLSSQWNLMRQHRSPAHTVWKNVHTPTKPSDDDKLSLAIQKIKETAAKIGVTLCEKTDDEVESTAGPSQKNKPSTPQQAAPPPDYNGEGGEREDSDYDTNGSSGPAQEDINLLIKHEKTCFWCWREGKFTNPHGREVHEQSSTLMGVDIDGGSNENFKTDPESTVLMDVDFGRVWDEDLNIEPEPITPINVDFGRVPDDDLNTDPDPTTPMDLDTGLESNEDQIIEQELANPTEEVVTEMVDSPTDMNPSIAEGEVARSDSDAYSFIMGGDDEVLPPLDNELRKAGGNGLPGLCKPGDIPILFRWYNDSSQGINTKDLIRAGLFAEDPSTELDTSNLAIDDYLGHFTDHVTKAKISSPFISTCLLPLTPIQRALKYQKNAMIAIIDTTKLDTVLIKASELVPLTNTRTPRWRGYGEYLVWKEVSAAAIICTFSLSRLEEIANESDDIGKLLQLDTIRKHHLSGRELYMEIAQKARTLQRPRVTFDRLMTHLRVPRDQQSLVIDKFEEAWSMDRRWAREGEAEGDCPAGRMGYGAYDHDEDSSHLNPDGETSAQDAPEDPPRHPRIRAGFVGETPPDFPYRPPSDLPDSDSSTSEEESAGSEPIARCPRHDTPSEGGYTLHDHDDDEDDEFMRWTLEEETASHGDVELFTPSEPSPSLRPHLPRSIPIPLDLNRGDDAASRAASRSPSEAQNVDENEIIEVD